MMLKQGEESSFYVIRVRHMCRYKRRGGGDSTMLVMKSVNLLHYVPGRWPLFKCLFCEGMRPWVLKGFKIWE
jgi:hypothetical protein